MGQKEQKIFRRFCCLTFTIGQNQTKNKIGISKNFEPI